LCGWKEGCFIGKGKRGGWFWLERQLGKRKMACQSVSFTNVGFVLPLKSVLLLKAEENRVYSLEFGQQLGTHDKKGRLGY